MTIPRVFISYSHDSQDHKKWVVDFATRLRHSGVDAILDQWELQPGDDIPHFMERNLASADRVLMICTENYVNKANGGTGGVGYEKMIVTADLMKSVQSNKIIPIIRQAGSCNVPTFLVSKYFVDFSNDAELEFPYDELLRALVGAPLLKKPEIGNNPFTPVAAVPAEPSIDAVRSLMQTVVNLYDKTTRDWVSYRDVKAAMPISRILLDRVIQDAEDQDLVDTDNDRDLYLTDKGKNYAVHHKLIKS